jgi:hypothetical protein
MSNRKVGQQQRGHIFERPKRRAGRPTKADLDDRAELKAWAAEEDEVRALIEESIAKGETSFLIPFPAPTPAMAFIIERLKGVPDRDGAVLKDALHDLLRSDLELDPKTRREVFDLYTRPPAQKRVAEARAFIASFESLKDYFCGRGMTAVEAEQEIAACRNWQLGTLHKNLQRARKRLRGAAK